jgi:hypothetical protein
MDQKHLCVVDTAIMSDQQQFIDASTDDLQQHMTGDLQLSARGLSGNRNQLGQCKFPQRKGPEMSGTRPQARGESAVSM